MQMPLVLTNRRRRGGSASAPAFSPTSLYSSGSQGIWLDPSDLSTMFSDRAGTIPVTTPGTVVGKRLDKSGRGNHAVAPTDAARPIYGVEPKGGRRNLLTYSEDFGNAAWSKANTTATASSITENTASSTHYVIQTHTYLAATYSYSVDLKPNGRQWVTVLANNKFSYFQLSGAGVLGNDGSTISRSITPLSDGWYRCSITFAATAGASDAIVYLASANGTVSYTGDGVSGVLIRNAQLELGSTATAYQRVLSAYDVTESGVATTHYVQYDGSDDSMSTAAIDFTATDKMSVFAGVRKLSDASRQMLVEHSANCETNAGSFGLLSPETNYVNDSNYGISLQGTTFVYGEMGAFVAPISNVVTVSFNIAATTLVTEIAGRVNGSSVTLGDRGGSAGTGNFGNYAMFIGRRNNATLPFNGRDFGIIVVGKAASAGEITDTELWLSDKTAQVTL